MLSILKIRRMPVTVAVVSAMIVLLSVRISQADDPLSGPGDQGIELPGGEQPSSGHQPFTIEPVSRLIYTGFYYDPGVAGDRYCLENSEGRCLDSEYNSFAVMEGRAQFYDHLLMVYVAELEGDDRLNFRKAYAKLRTGTVSWEFGKDSVWFGNGYHGSLLLSNNAEGFTLLRMKTEKPIRLPWIFSHMGDFSYDIVHGWLDDFNILAHRLVYRPHPIVEFGATQTAIYSKDRRYKWYEYPRILFSSEDNSGDRLNKFDNDQRASMDVLLHMPFLSRVPPFRYGKVYFEYGGEDAVAWWQKEDREWVWPFGFALTVPARLYGIHLETNSFDYRFEYARNYSSEPFRYGEKGWYTKIPYEYKGVGVGHHMGPYADDLFFEVGYHSETFSCRVFYDRERHGLNIIDGTPEKRDQLGIVPSYRWDRYRMTVFFVKNWYHNVDYDPDPLRFDIRPGTSKDETAAGIELALEF